MYFYKLKLTPSQVNAVEVAVLEYSKIEAGATSETGKENSKYLLKILKSIGDQKWKQDERQA